jgi:hypothetical protein
MNRRSLILVLGILTALTLATADPAEARGFGNRGGGGVYLGRGGRRPTNARMFGPSFALAPRVNRFSGQSATQFQQRPWYYDRSGPVQYYRPYRPLYSTR